MGEKRREGGVKGKEIKKKRGRVGVKFLKKLKILWCGREWCE